VPKKVKNWSKRKFGHAKKLLKEKMKALELIQKDEGPNNVEDIK
jgi:hypothetical protein